MILSPGIARLMGVISVGMVFTFFKMILGWIDRRAGAPIMRERINDASETFFVEQEKHWGELETESTGKIKLPAPDPNPRKPV
ncbi:MAG: hypothetical protein ACXU9O_00620 [Gemmatimonadaceae bacterium]